SAIESIMEMSGASGPSRSRPVSRDRTGVGCGRASSSPAVTAARPESRFGRSSSAWRVSFVVAARPRRSGPNGPGASPGLPGPAGRGATGVGLVEGAEHADPDGALGQLAQHGPRRLVVRMAAPLDEEVEAAQPVAGRPGFDPEQVDAGAGERFEDGHQRSGPVALLEAGD